MRITPLLPALVLSGIVPGWISAQSVKESRQDDLSYEKLGPVLDNLPTGSTLKGMRVPVFNKKRERMALLQSGLVKIITRRELTGEKIVLRYFQKDAVIMRINLGAADFSLNTGILRARRAITLGGEQLQGQGSGGIFHLRTRSGVIRGPVSTRFTTSPTEERDDKANGTDRTPPDPSGQNATASTSPTETRAEDNPLATVFTGPEPLTGAELRKINELLQSRSKSVLANRAPTRNFMTQSRQSSNKADTDFLSFAHNVQMPRGKLLARTPPREPAEVTPITMETGEVLVTAGGGMFLNPEQGHISYLREIEVTESRFTMTAAGHLKVFFPPQDLSKAITRPGSDPGEGDELEGGRIAEKGEEESFAELVDPHLLVATGGVRIIYNDPAGRAPPLLATGETAIVDRRSGDIVLQGGTPTIRQGTNSLTAGSPELYLRLYQNGDLYAEEGLWTTVGELTALAPSRPGNGGQEGVGNEETEDAPPTPGRTMENPKSSRPPAGAASTSMPARDMLSTSRMSRSSILNSAFKPGMNSRCCCAEDPGPRAGARPARKRSPMSTMSSPAVTFAFSGKIPRASVPRLPPPPSTSFSTSRRPTLSCEVALPPSSRATIRYGPAILASISASTRMAVSLLKKVPGPLPVTSPAIAIRRKRATRMWELSP